jgi:quinoprotein glucose dehydrogenase
MLAAIAAALALQDEYKPYVAPASDEGEQAIARMKWPEGFDVKLWAAEPLLANPVAIALDDRGGCYVAETFRIKAGVDDIRDHMDWLDDDVAARTVEDRLAYLQRHLGDKFASYSVEQDRVRFVADTDGDGRADASSVFADGFGGSADGIGAGVLAWKDRIYYTCIPNLWLLRDRDGDHRADERRALSTGYGIRFALYGHDLHGLTIGPDGKLYFSCGDRGLSVPLANGTRLNNQFNGAVLRCNLDGSDLEVFATGLRNPQELVFDEYGELFTVDNNSDGGDKARLVHVIEGMDAGWRQAYQWITEPDLRGPWNDEGLWKPHFEGQAAYIVPPIANVTDGPSGLTYNPGAALAPEYRDHFFVCDFRGDPAISGIHAFTLKPKGASFELDRFERFVWGTLAVDCDFGPDGALYWCDWVEGWDETGKGRIYRLASASTETNATAAERSWLISTDLGRIGDGDLLPLLGHTNRRVRVAAQHELAGRLRGNTWASGSYAPGDRVTTLHAIWAYWLAQTCETRGSEPIEFHNSIFGARDPIVRANALRVVSDFGEPGWGDAMVASLSDADPVVQRYAAIGAGKVHASDAVGPLAELARRVGESDPALRHAAIYGLAGCATAEQLVALKSDASSDVRVAAIVALRQQKSVEVAEFLGDSDERVVVEAARAIYDEQLAGAMPALADLIGQVSTKSTAIVRRMLNANFRLGGEERAAALAEFATRADADEPHRWEAIELLSRWEQPPGRDFFTGEWWPLPERDASFMPALVREMRQRGIERAPERVLVEWIELAGQCGAASDVPALVQLAKDAKRAEKVRVAALHAVAEVDAAALEPSLAELMLDPSTKVRAEALRATLQLDPAKSRSLVEFAALEGSRDERRVAYEALAALDDGGVDALLAAEVDGLRAGLVPAEVALDLVQAAEKRESSTVKAALARLRELRALDPRLAPWLDSLYGGDKERGRKLFREKAETNCLKCHRIEWGEGGEVGPDLAGVGTRLARLQLAESIADPNRKISRGYDATIFTLDDGTHVAGVVIEGDDTTLRVRDSDDRIVAIERASIESQRADVSSMPDNVATFLSRSEMRDLIEYLANL